MNSLHSICVFCGSSSGTKAVYSDAAVALGRAMAQRQIGLVYGGGSVGLMGAIARTVADGGAPVKGIIPRALQPRELAGETIGELHVVDSMHERKLLMARHADAFIAMPGGFGTMDELFEVVTWGQLGIQRKAIGLLNVNGYWDPMLAWIEHALNEQFIRPHHRNLIVVADEPPRPAGAARAAGGTDQVAGVGPDVVTTFSVVDDGCTRGNWVPCHRTGHTILERMEELRDA